MTGLRRPEAWVFVILWASYAYFWHGRDWNSASRLMLTYAIVDRGTLSIDGLNDQTGDIARYQDHYYTDKTPGFSILGIAPYALSKKAFGLPSHPLNQPGFAVWAADYWITLGTSGLLTALTGSILVVLARDLGCGPRRSALVGLAYGLATPAFAYATLAYGHQPAAFCLLASFAILGRDGSRPLIRSAFAGFFASYASVVEIQVGPVSAILGIYLLGLVVSQKRPASTILTFGIGAAIPAAILLGYNNQAFGSPWRMGYFYLIMDRFKEVHSADNPLGLSRPDWSKLGELLWGERRGLLRFAPILVLTVPGLILAGARRSWGMVGVVVSTILAIFLMNLSYPEWTGGWTTGPRLLVPLIPFAILPVASLLAVGGRTTTALAVVLALVGGWIILMFQMVGARIPDGIARPLVDGVWPLIRGDRPLPFWVYGSRYAGNLTRLAWPEGVKLLPAGLGWVQFLPLVVVQASLIGLMMRVVRPDQTASMRSEPEPTPRSIARAAE